MRRKLTIYISGLVILFGLVMSGYNLLAANQAAQADEYLPTDFLEEGDKFKLIIDINNQGYGAVTYSYEFAD